MAAAVLTSAREIQRARRVWTPNCEPSLGACDSRFEPRPGTRSLPIAAAEPIEEPVPADAPSLHNVNKSLHDVHKMHNLHNAGVPEIGASAAGHCSCVLHPGLEKIRGAPA